MANKLSLDDVLSGNFAKARLDDTKPSNTNKLSLKDVLAGNFNKKTTLPTTDPDIITPSRRSDNTRNKPKVINPEIKEGLGYMGKRAWTGLTQDAPAAAIQALGLSVGKAISEFNTESPITAFDKIKKADSFGDKLSAGLEGIVNYSPYTNGPAAGPAAAVPKTLANVAKGVVDVFTNKEDAEKTAEKIFNYAEPFVERSEEVQREGEKYPDWVQTGAKATGAVGMMLPSIALSALTRSPNVGLTAMSMMAGGSAGKEAYDKTGDLDVAWNYGAAAGVTEFATERMFHLMDPFLGASGADKAIKKMLSGLNDYKVVKTLLTGALGATGEGIEEVIVELVDPYLRRATFDPNAPQAKKEDLVEVFTVGALAGLIMKGTMGPIQAIGDNKQRRQYVQQKADAANELASMLPTEHRPEILEITSRTTIEEVDEYYGKIIDAANTAEQEIGKRDYSEYPLEDSELGGNPRLAEVREKYKDEVEKLESLYGTINLTPEQREEATAVHSIDVATLEKEAQDAARDFYLPPKMRLEKAIVEGIAHKYYSPEVIRRYIDQKKEADKAIKPKVLVGGKQVDKTKFMSQLKEKDPTLEDNELEEMFIKAQLESSRNLKVEEFVMQTNEAFSQYGVKVDVSYYLPKQERGFYDPKTKTITLNAKTIKSRSVASYVLSHEITHYAIAKDPELLSQLKQSAKLLDYDISQHNEGIRNAYEKRTGQTLSEEYLTEESIADFVSTVLQDDNLLMQLANKKPTTLQRVAQVITDALMYTRQDRAIRKYKKDVAKKLSAALEGRLVVDSNVVDRYSLDTEYDAQYNTKEEIKALISKYYHKDEGGALDVATEAISDLQVFEERAISAEYSSRVDRFKRSTGLGGGRTEFTGAGRVVARRFTSELIDKGQINFTGLEIKSVHELATLAQVYRDPRFETRRIFFMRGKTVVGQEALSSRLPSISKIYREENRGEFAKKLQEKMGRLKADSFYFMHNHPSGDPEPSESDKRLTEVLNHLFPEFKGHIIINSNKYAVSNRAGSIWATRGLDLGEDILIKPATPNPIFGQKLDSVEKVAAALKTAQVNTADCAIGIFLGAKYDVQTVMELNISFMLKNKEEYKNFIKNRLVEYGAKSVVISYPKFEPGFLQGNDYVENDYVELGVLDAEMVNREYYLDVLYDGEVESYRQKYPLIGLPDWQTLISDGGLPYWERAPIPAPRYSLENENVGYRAGKFGKSERYFNMMSGNRGTGHFGTGTYFVGDPSKIELEAYNKRTQHMVDFNGYNLFKPRTSQQAFDIHDFLKFVNYDNQKLGALNYSTDQIVEEKNKVYNATESILDFLSLYDFDKEKVFKASDEYFDFTDAELIKENEEYARNKEIIKAAIANRALISWRAINNIRNEAGKGVGYKTPEWNVYNYYSGLQEYFEENFIRDILETQREVTERLNIGARVLGLTVEDLQSELQYISERYALAPSWFDEDAMAQDTPATIFMKRLGYEGVDVRGLKEVDNTAYGSVIYDLNPSSIRYSLSPDFYNKSTKLIETKLPKNLNGTQTLEWLRNGQNIREEELKWTGLAVYLTEKGSEKVSKEELLEFIAANELPISEVLLKTVFSEEDWPEDLKQLHSEYTELYHEIDETLKSAINKVVDENITFELAYYHKDVRDPRVYAKDKNGEVITFGYASSHYNLNTLLGSDTGRPSLEGVQVPFVEAALKIRIHNWLYATLSTTYDYEETTVPLQRLKDVAKSKLPSDFGEKIKQGKLLHDSFYDMELMASRRFLWDGANKTIYDFLALKPHSNYKELLFHWDIDGSSDRGGFRSGHFNETGGEYGDQLLMHARISDGRDVNSGKVLFIEELQSDWHEQGLKEGYMNFPSPAEEEILRGRRIDLWALSNRIKDEISSAAEDIQNNLRGQLSEVEREILEINMRLEPDGEVSDAPLKKTWHEFLLKRLIAKAAQEDYSRIAWTTGQQQIDRYPEMVKPIIWVQYSPTPDGDWIVDYKLQGKSADESEVVHTEVIATEQELKALVGKRITRDIVNKRGVAVGSEFFELSYPEVVQAGGEGMLNFYDIGGESSQNIARFMDKYGKQWGAKVEMAEIDGIMQPSMEITPEMRESVLKYGQELRYSLQTEQLNMFDNELLKSVMFSPIKEPLSDSQKWYFKDSAVRRKNGDLLKVYHGTRVNDLSVFGKGDIGFHFGTKSQAINRVGRGKNSHIIEAYLNIKNPLFIDADLGDWEANYQLLPELLEMGVFTAEEVKAVKEIPYFRESGYRSPAAIKIREMLAEKGYDGIKYLNWFEATGNDTFSYIAFYPEQIKAVNNFLPTSDPDIRYSLGSEAIDRFGTTEDYREVGYIMADGTMLDFSEKNNGGPGGTRTLDHRAIAWLYDDDSDIDGIEAVIAFVNDGNVRVSPEAPGIELSTETKPTSRQLVRIAKFVDRADDFFAVDFVDPNGDVVHPLFYEGEISTKKVMADINRFYGEGISGIRYALEMNDDAYLNAVNSGDMRSAQKLVDAMARKAGYTVKAYHGTRNQFTEFDRSRTGDNYGGYSASGTMFDFSTDKDTARAWGVKAKGEGRVRIVPAYLKVVKTFYTYDGPVPKDLRGVLPETLDAVTKDKIMDFGAPFKTYVEEELGLDWAETLYKYGYDSESMHKSYQATGDPISVYSPSQIKSADPVTYDENGEVIPLSQRFDKGNPDIRYSLDGAQDNTGSKITHQQHNYFKGTKVVDAQGKLKKVYHGTMSDFWEFSREHSNPESDMGAGYYFTDNEEDVWSNYATPNGADLNNKIERLADEYIINEDLSEEEAVERARRELMTREEPRTIEAYLKIEKPLILDWRNSTLFDFNMNYDEETGEYGEFEGTFVDFIESVVNVLEFHEATENYIEDMQELYFKFADDETIFAYDAINAVKEVLAFYEDPETGYLAANEIIRQAIEDMGFDGIIDKMVSWKWGKDSGRRYVMKGVSSDTTHYIIFDSSQAKEVDNLEPTNSQDLRHSIDDYEDFIKKWKDAQEKYGVKSPGMAPRIETEGNEVPRQFSDDTKASNLLRTTMESPNTPEDFRDPLKLRALSGTGSYLPVSDANALDIANNIITRRGISGATDKWRGIITGQKALNKSDIALGELLLIEAADRGDLEEWEKIVGELCAEATRAGQVVQAFSMLKKLSPQGRIYNIKALVTKLQDELDVRTKGKAPALKIRQELLDQLLQARTIAEMEAIEHEIIKEIAQQIPPRISDRVVAWRYLSMLGNARTHIRNIVSNMFMMVERTLKDVVAATAEGVAGSINPNMQRTKTLAFASQEVRDFVRQDWQVMKPAMLGGGKLGLDDIFARYKKNFGKSVGGRMLNFLDKLNMEGLNVEDSIFMGVAYRKALASYLTANKFSTQFINSGTKEANEALARARKYAVEEGLKATYREANSLATALNNIEQKNVATKIIVGGLMPFKKTPLNIIKRGVEYSPAGLLEAISIEKIRLARGKITAAQYFDRLSSGLVGSAAFGLGMYLAFLGLAKAGGSDDKEEYYEQMLGNQPYSITVGGRNYTIDWLTPASMPLMAGVELVTTIMKDGKIDVDEIDFNRLFGALITTADPLTELSMLQGINQALSGYGENRLGETVASAAQSYAGQFIPTLFGQAARTVDPVRRTTYAAKDTDFPFGKKGEQFVNKLINKADVLNRVEKEPYLDMWGREDIRPDNLALRALEQFVTPYYAKDMQKTAVDDELARVFQVNKATEVLPSTPRGNITIDGTTFQLSPKEYTEYKRKVGTQSHAILDDVFKTPEYRNLDQESKEAVIKKVYSYVKEDAKADYAEKKNIEYEAESVLEKVDTAKGAGIDMGTYFVTADQIQRIESDKNPVTGEGVRKDAYGLETRKTKVINYLKGLDITPEEKYAIYLMYYKE